MFGPGKYMQLPESASWKSKWAVIKFTIVYKILLCIKTQKNDGFESHLLAINDINIGQYSWAMWSQKLFISTHDDIYPVWEVLHDSHVAWQE